jgi:hypothetical protein
MTKVVARLGAGALVAAGLVGVTGGVASAAPDLPKDTTCAVLHGNGNGAGANVSGAYDETCNDADPAPSLNGNGDGNAFGKPCAGCVGNADDKNPPGQAPDGTDANNGYECDGNNGVGKTNPAHTGCEEDEPET